MSKRFDDVLYAAWKAAHDRWCNHGCGGGAFLQPEEHEFLVRRAFTNWRAEQADAPERSPFD